MERLETTLVPGILGPKLPPTLKSLFHPDLSRPGAGQAASGPHLNVPVGLTATRCLGALRISSYRISHIDAKPTSLPEGHKAHGGECSRQLGSPEHSFSDYPW